MALQETDNKKEGKAPLPAEHYIREEIKLTREIGAQLLSTNAEVKEAFVAYMNGLLSARENSD